jgi:nucleotide-binding universal stress UspA family protein
MTIIAATDFSPTAANATESAAQLARRLGTRLLLVRVVEPPLAIYPELRVPDLAPFEAALRTSNEERMNGVVAALQRDGLVVEGRVLVGEPVSALAEEAAAQGATAIVVGTRGHGALTRVLLGSVAERLVMEAPCPVLVVPDGATPFAVWGERPLRVLAGLDFDPAGEAVLAALETLRAAAPCDVTVVHTYWPPTEYTRLGLPPPRDLAQTDPQIVAVLDREIGARLPILPGRGDTHLRIHAAWGRIADALAQDAEDERADLIVVGTRQPHGWERLRSGSACLATLRTARRAVLCVPARRAPAVAPTARAPLPTIRTVLVPTDLSALGNRAIPQAYGLLKGRGGVVELVHVHERHLPNPPYAYEPGAAPLTAAERSEIEARLRALVPADAAALGIETHVTVIEGGAAGEAIVQAARRLGADAIAIASHGRSGLARTLMGSVAETVLRGFEGPVLVLHVKEGEGRT